MSQNINKLNELLSDFNIELTDKQLKQFDLYYQLLIDWNEKINLTAITEFDEVLLKHFKDSLGLIKGLGCNIIDDICKNGKELSLIDVGCGAGFPSIPLKIAFPNLRVTLLDSLNKRVKFLNEVIAKLELENIEAVHGRAEEVAANKDYREKYDIAVSRAVANMCTLSEYCLPFVKKNGIFAAYKSEELLNKRQLSEQELSELQKTDIKYILAMKPEKEVAAKAVKILGGQIENINEYFLSDNEYFRCLCIVRKKEVTPKKYPRKAGLPSKEPIV